MAKKNCSMKDWQIGKKGNQADGSLFGSDPASDQRIAEVKAKEKTW